MTSHFIPPSRALDLTDGLLAWTRLQGPDMWHEIAAGIDFAAPEATVDLLLATQWITAQPNCCRATAVLFLAHMLAAGLLTEAAPALAPEAARALTLHLHAKLARGGFAEPQFRLSPAQAATVKAMLGPEGVLPLSPALLTAGRRIARAPHAFHGWRPVTSFAALCAA